MIMMRISRGEDDPQLPSRGCDFLLLSYISAVDPIDQSIIASQGRPRTDF